VQGQRFERVGELIRQELGQLLVTRVKDPDVEGVTITEVVVTPDLSMAKVYFAVRDERAQRVQRGLERALPFLQRQIGSALRMKKVPRLRFHRDRAIEEGEQVDSLLREIAKSEESES
jgi:ribosome-binding factor A